MANFLKNKATSRIAKRLMEWCLNIISKRTLAEAERRHRELEGALDTWFRISKRAKWTCLNDVRKTFRDTDEVDGKTVFNIKGNNFRLITGINYRSQTIFIKEVLTHAEYDKEGWK
jgi:mRNA interferase HigB